LAGGVPGQGVLVEGVKEANKSPAGRNTQNGTKNGRFPAFFGLKYRKIAKNAIFLSKVLNKIYSKDVF
jgi:hypothetical protein